VTSTIDSINSVEHRRTGVERRNYSLRTLSNCLLQPRRAYGRRTEDRRYPQLDTFDGGIVTLAILLTVFSILDALFTLTLLQHGGTELNPVMRYFLNNGGTVPFILAKLLLTTVPALIMVAMQNVKVFGRWRVRSILAALVGGYAGLLVYELILLSYT